MFFFVIWKFIADIIQILFLKGFVIQAVFYPLFPFRQTIGLLNL